MADKTAMIWQKPLFPPYDQVPMQVTVLQKEVTKAWLHSADQASRLTELKKRVDELEGLILKLRSAYRDGRPV